MFTCKGVSRLVSDSLDRKLPLWQRLAVRYHLTICAACKRFQKQVNFLHNAARRYLHAEAELTADEQAKLSPEASERIKRSLKNKRP